MQIFDLVDRPTDETGNLHDCETTIGLYAQSISLFLDYKTQITHAALRRIQDLPGAGGGGPWRACAARTSNEGLVAMPLAESRGRWGLLKLNAERFLFFIQKRGQKLQI